MFDALCGDFLWMSHVRLPEDFHYIGGDIVPDLVRDLERYSTQSRKFIIFDVRYDVPPPVDLWLCRDCLFTSLMPKSC